MLCVCCLNDIGRLYGLRWFRLAGHAGRNLISKYVSRTRNPTVPIVTSVNNNASLELLSTLPDFEMLSNDQWQIVALGSDKAWFVTDADYYRGIHRRN